ncbi:hypothetical protein BN14_06689 [Rhizoctonia solani AG-1 IB]|uniref:Uncharacterized protein n=1 Tax=Thanatephorus cucumeris (strain AG1-IB / isolate 7/3/14) TaxID=1108050 RepID=M5BZH8_THACB|nr:hypothetical protein BN14_06689 [Rhizoctonia solani AG-1 IB]
MGTPNAHGAAWRAFQHGICVELAKKQGKEVFEPLIARKAYVRQRRRFTVIRPTPNLSKYVPYMSSPAPESSPTADSSPTAPPEPGPSGPVACTWSCRSHRPHDAVIYAPTRCLVHRFSHCLAHQFTHCLARGLARCFVPAVAVVIAVLRAPITLAEQAIHVTVSWLPAPRFAPAFLIRCLASAVTGAFPVDIAIVRVPNSSVDLTRRFLGMAPSLPTSPVLRIRGLD